MPTTELTFSESASESDDLDSDGSDLDHGWGLGEELQEGKEGGADEGDIEGYEDFNEPCDTPINGQNVAGNHHSSAITAQSQEIASTTSPIATQEDPSTSRGNVDCDCRAQVEAPDDEELPSPVQKEHTYPWHSLDARTLPDVDTAKVALANLKDILHPKHASNCGYKVTGLTSLLEKRLTWMEYFLRAFVNGTAWSAAALQTAQFIGKGPYMSRK
ncbi:hypothetical protein OG21DRAFT_1490679, partial [Imleria badia]